MKIFSFILIVLFSTNLIAQSFNDIDKDNDGLIEVSNIEMLNAMRYQLDGSGLRWSTTTEVITTGCAVGGCNGYELTRDLDFKDAASYQDFANMGLWTTGAGWQPIGNAEHPFTAIFKTNNSSTPNTIFNLRINRANESHVGLLSRIGSSAEISGIGLLDAEVAGHNKVGGLVGESAGGQINNSYVSGRVVGNGGEVGLLVGRSSGSITNSYANGEVSGEANSVGGLVGANRGEIANSYAMGSVVGGANNVGGLVGDNMQGEISNCYTTGSVSGSEDIGGLVGLSNLGTLVGNYVSGKASGTRYIGGLVGSNIGGTITRSYWDKTTSGLKSNSGGVGLLAIELQSASAQDADLSKPYYKWSTAHWDFGTAEQYPILKYAAGSNLNNPACGPARTLPNCGALLLGQHASLERILFLGEANLSSAFKPTALNYQLSITTGTTSLQLIPIASNPDSTINISRNGVAIDNNLASGTTSSVIPLNEDTKITIEVSATNQRPAHYQLTTNYQRTITIAGIPEEAIYEGEPILLDATQGPETADDLWSYRWTQTTGKALLHTPEREDAILWLYIPEDYVSATADYAKLGLTLEINNSKETITKDITLTIAKINNGNIPLGPPALNSREWTAPEVDLSRDPDGSGEDFSYQWQSRAPGQDAQWIDIDKATKKTHTLPFLTEPYTEYRVLISYTDGQGYKNSAASETALYTPKTTILDFLKGLASEVITPEDAKPQRTPNVVFNCSNDDIDDDDNGLIEICDLEGLNAIRYQLDGTGYKANESATKITAGCREGGCKGYELIRDLDFNDDASYSSTPNKVTWTTGAGWQPIGYFVSSNNSNNKPFNAIFEGNNHTISKLMINRPNTYSVGLFGYTREGTKIINVGLLNVKVKGDYFVGSLVGRNWYGTITNSYATGDVTGSRYDIGGLVGQNWYGPITNSYAIGNVTGGYYVGSLVGRNWYGDITNSYAAGAVTGDFYAGGLVGGNEGKITNSYATSSVTGRSYVGGLVGSSSGNITNSYATGNVKGNDSRVGGLVGSKNGGNITNSYWDEETSRIMTSAGGIGKTTEQLQSPTTATGIYDKWSTDNWDFGTSKQYSILKYAPGPDADNPACRGTEDTTKDLPVCGNLLSPILRYGLSELRLTEGYLSPDFIASVPNYKGTVVNATNSIQFKPIAINSSAKISIEVDGEELDKDIPSGTTSSEIQLNLNDTTEITIEVENEGIVSATTYTLSLSYYAFNGDIDDDNDGLIEIYSLEELNAIRYQLDGSGYRKSEDSPKITVGCAENGCNGYELMRDLDFNEDASYSNATANKRKWTTGKGWQPIGVSIYRFNCIFEGNNNTISNLLVDRPRSGHLGLFDVAGYDAEISNIGLFKVDINGGSNTGGLVGENLGIITNSYMTGIVTYSWQAPYGYSIGGLVGFNKGVVANSYSVIKISGRANTGGLIGENHGEITNSYAIGDVVGRFQVGGLVGQNRNGGQVSNSYAISDVYGRSSVGGLVGRNWDGKITNSYAKTSSVQAEDHYAGGLVGKNIRGTISNNYAVSSHVGAHNPDRAKGLVGLKESGTISHSYWDTETSRITSGNNGIGYTTEQLQSPTAPGSASTDIYYGWSTNNWDFGTNTQYPILKYAKGPDTNNPACRGPMDTTDLPVCGDLLSPIFRYGLSELRLTQGNLSPDFIASIPNYKGTAVSTTNSIQFKPTAINPSAMISIKIDGEEPHEDISSGTTSNVIQLNRDSITKVIIEVKDSGGTAKYTLYLDYYAYDGDVA